MGKETNSSQCLLGMGSPYAGNEDPNQANDDSSASRASSTAMSKVCSMRQNKWNLTALIIFIGAAVTAAFVAVGVQGSQNSSIYNFEQRSTEIMHAFESAWDDYELFALWTHESCTKPFYNATDIDFEFGQYPGLIKGYCSRQEFRKIYEYMVSEGLDIQAAQFLPNVSHAERPYLEHEAREHYAKYYPHVNYTGFKQFRQGGGLQQFSEDRPVYFPVHLLEPVETNEGVIDLDLYSSVTVHKRAINEAMETWKPVVSDRLKLVQDAVRAPNAYSTLLFHPGTKISFSDATQATALSLLVIRIPDLMLRATKNVKRDATIYVHDATNSESREDAVFMGANAISIQDGIPVLTDLNVTRLSDIPLPKHSRSFEKEVPVANRVWIVTVVSELDEPDIVYVVVGGAVIFLACILVAVWFHHHLKVATAMSQTQNILSSMFPQDIQARLMENGGGIAGTEEMNSLMLNSKNRKGFQMPSTKPIADYSPHTTILFADIVGFTAWSSAREPSQVFTLLETLFHQFDQLANRRKVFKVETVGDCYVAVAGLPIARKDHAVIMVRFASDLLGTFANFTKNVEVVLGPDTAELGLRIGVHSGAVTSGVLRGERPRFQLFGDTVNTTARIESSGERGKIHISEDTATLLREAGKGDWLTQREDRVEAKGKGVLQTYWADTNATRSSTPASDAQSEASFEEMPVESENKLERFVDWNVEQLVATLKQVVHRRKVAVRASSREQWKEPQDIGSQTIPFEEVKEIITLPKYSSVASVGPVEELPDVVVQQLRHYVYCVANLYQSNPFHNFDHASHVVMSVTKLMSRIVAPSHIIKEGDPRDLGATLHDHTYGITSDPLTQFACAFSALIHDVDHSGVPNTQLCKENKQLAEMYKYRSVAEQNSLDLCWNLLMDPQFEQFLRVLCPTSDDLGRFRQIVVNAVMATDIMDKDLKQLRNDRWEKAFHAAPEESCHDDVNRKATIVIEHLIQASDVAHTMQHWNIYRKWNERLFHEMYLAYQQGRADKNPADFWYKGEIGFFDFYIIPLAKKLKDCGVFGVSCDEYLNYAVRNRAEWEARGQEVVAEMIAAIKEKTDVVQSSS